MKQKLILALLCLLPIAAGAQVASTIPSTGGGASCVSIGVGSKGSTIGITITGTWSGTLQPQIAIQGQSAANVQVTPSTSSTAQSTITGNGTFTASVAGSDTFQICGNTVASGTANVYLNISTAGSTAKGGSGGSGTVTSLTATAPIVMTPSPTTATGVASCATCVVASSPGVGLAHFAGSTQTVTSSAVNLAGADVTGNLPVTNLNSGTSASSSTFWRGDGTWAAAGGGTLGPVVDYVQCSNTQGNVSQGSLQCTSIVNVTIGDVFVMFCSAFTNDGGTATLTASDNLVNTWTQAVSFYGSGPASRVLASTTTATVGGSDTFTCTASANKTFWSMAVVKVNNFTAVDTTVTVNQGGASGLHMSTPFTTATDNELAFMFSAGNGSTTVGRTAGIGSGFDIFQTSVLDAYGMSKKLGKAGSYNLQNTGPSTNYAAVTVVLK